MVGEEIGRALTHGGQGAAGQGALQAVALDLAQQLSDYRAQLSAISLERDWGGEACSARQCESRNALPCAFVDEEGRACTTAWCAEHRSVKIGVVFCLDHSRRVNGERIMHASQSDRTFAVVRWASQEVDAEMSSLLRSLLLGDDAITATPVRFTQLAGAQAHGYWERTWEIVSAGIGQLRVSLGADETEPSEIVIRVNNREVIKLDVPWAPDHGLGHLPQSQIELWRSHHNFRRRLCAAVGWVAEEWQFYRQMMAHFEEPALV